MALVYPNQKVVRVHKEPANKDHLYGILNKQAAMAAFRNPWLFCEILDYIYQHAA